MRHAFNSVVAITAGLLLSAPAAAQQAKQQQADAIHARALVLQQDQTKLIAAARLYLREAELRGDDDRQTVKSLRTAAHLLHYGKRGAEARKAMEASAELAAAQGDVLVAAQTFVLAAWMAQNSGKRDDARRFAHKAKLLAGSPLLAAGDRDAILAHVNRVTTVSLR
jgi:hypothetical protein